MKPKWAKKLNKSEWRHLQETTCGDRPTLASFMRNFEHHNKNSDECRECREIARKIGLVKEEK